MGLGNLTLEVVVSTVHLLWFGGWWFVARAFFTLLAGPNGSKIVEPAGFIALFISNVIFFYISRHVLNFIYKRELPGGEELTKDIVRMFGQNQNGKKRR
jgi:hypothetical protein